MRIMEGVCGALAVCFVRTHQQAHPGPFTSEACKCVVPTKTTQSTGRNNGMSLFTMSVPQNTDAQ